MIAVASPSTRIHAWIVPTARTGVKQWLGVGTVKLTQRESIDPQNTALESVVNPPCWASETIVSLNVTILGGVVA